MLTFVNFIINIQCSISEVSYPILCCCSFYTYQSVQYLLLSNTNTLVEEPKVFKKQCWRHLFCIAKTVHIFFIKTKLRTALYIVFVIRIHYFVIIKTHPLCNPNYNTIMRFTSGGISQVNGGVRSREWLRSVSVVSI